MNRSLSMCVSTLVLLGSMSGCYAKPYAGGVPEVPKLENKADVLRARYCAEVELEERRAAEGERRRGGFLVKVGLTLGTVALASLAASRTTKDDDTSDRLDTIAATTGVVGGVALLGGLTELGMALLHGHDEKAERAAKAAIDIASLDTQRKEAKEQTDLERRSNEHFAGCLAEKEAEAGAGQGQRKESPGPTLQNAAQPAKSGGASKELSAPNQPTQSAPATTATPAGVTQPATTTMSEPPKAPATTTKSEPPKAPATTTMSEPPKAPATTTKSEPPKAPATTTKSPPATTPPAQPKAPGASK